MAAKETVHGKLILSGEYAVVFGYPAIAIPSRETMRVTFHKGTTIDVQWKEEEKNTETMKYAEHIAELIAERTGVKGSYSVQSNLPVGKGMGSSTALVISFCHAALSTNRDTNALEIERIVNPGHSGVDYGVITLKEPLLFRKGETPKVINLPDILENIELIDTGKPEQQTPELVAWVKKRKDEPEIRKALETIGQCTERILQGEDIKTVIRDHHRAQVALGVVPESAQKIIDEIERGGGAAKVLGAGSRTGGGGMVLKFD